MIKNSVLVTLAMFIFGLFAGQVSADLIERGRDSLGRKLIYDTDLDITWYDYSAHPISVGAPYYGGGPWISKTSWADNLSVSFEGQTYNDWRLPSTPWYELYVDGYPSGRYPETYNHTSSEMGHLYYMELGNVPHYDPIAGRISGNKNMGPFENLIPSNYVSGTEYNELGAYMFDFGSGYEGFARFEWPWYRGIAVRDGDVLAGVDTDGDGILDNGDNFGVAGDNPCKGYQTQHCDDNCVNEFNPDQADADYDGIGDLCESGPIAAISGPDQLYVNQSGDFDGSKSSSPNGFITNFDWTFWDANNYLFNAYVSSWSHSWGVPGAYEVELKVTDNIGKSDKTSKTVNVIQGGPEIVDVKPIQFYPKKDGDQFVIELGEEYALDIKVIENNPTINPVLTEIKVKENVLISNGDIVYKDQSDIKQMPPQTLTGFCIPHHWAAYKHFWKWIDYPFNDPWDGVKCFHEIMTVPPLADIFVKFMTSAISGSLTIAQAVTQIIEAYALEGVLIKKSEYEYTITATDDHGTDLKKVLVAINVPQYKINALEAYFKQSIVAGVSTGIGTYIFSYSPPLAAAFLVVEAGLMIKSSINWQIAVDPDPNYTEPAVLESISLSTINNLTDPRAKNLGNELLIAIAAQKAMGKSLGRYEGAKAAGDKKWMITHLEAAYRFSDLLLADLSDLQTSITSLMEELNGQGIIVTQEDFKKAKTQLLNDGLPQLERDILTELGFSEEAIYLAGQNTAALMDYMPTDWQALMMDGMAAIIDSQIEITNWINERISLLKMQNDSDQDGILDDEDNCALISNEDQDDADNDGVGGLCDCDDNNPNINSRAIEICNGIDDNCNGRIDEETIAPEITVSVSPDTLWPPNHKMVLVSPVVSVIDGNDSNLRFELTSISMNEGKVTKVFNPKNDTTLGDGNNTEDIQIDASGNVYLRAERSGKGVGRVYTITYAATDSCGNSTTASTTVTVPHNR